METKENIVAELLQDLKQAENRAEKKGWIDSSTLEKELGVLKNE